MNRQASTFENAAAISSPALAGAWGWWGYVHHHAVT